MRASTFRSDPSLVSQWSEMLQKHALLRLVLEVMEEEHPARFALQGDNDGDISATRAAIELGMTRGYSKYSDTLRLLAISKQDAQPLPETTYPVEEQPRRRGRPPKKK